MRPRKRETEGSDDLFRARLDQIINMQHELVRLADQKEYELNLESLPKSFAEFACKTVGIIINRSGYLYPLQQDHTYRARGTLDGKKFHVTYLPGILAARFSN